MRARRRGRFGTSFILLVAVGIALVKPATVNAEAEGGLEFEGVVAEGGEAYPLFVDPIHRKLYTADRSGNSSTKLSEFDLDAPYGAMLTRQVYLPMNGLLTEDLVATDLGRQRAFIADRDLPTICPDCSVIRVLDLKTLEFIATWHLFEAFPNFFIQGITYSQDDERLYIAGTVVGDAAVLLDFGQAPYYPVSIIALDATTGTVAWSRTLAKCLRPMVTIGEAGGLFRGRNGLYLGCVRADVALNVAPYPGFAGVLRLPITPAGNQADALLYREEFFRVSGAYFSLFGPIASAIFDYATERMVFTNSSWSTPGAWIFDGHMSSWVGFVPSDIFSNFSLGLDQVTGHLYTLNDPSGLTVTDLRTTPVPQGVSFTLSSPEDGLELMAGVPYVTDSLTRRVFVYTRVMPKTAKYKLVAFRDRTPLIPPDPSLRYDSLTDGIAEGPDTSTTFSSTARGFGARASVVGGIGGLISPARNGIGGTLQGQFVGDPIAPADRGLWAARVSAVDLRNVSATADAQAIVSDDVTSDQRRSAQNDAAKAGASEAAVSKADWPWPAAFCLDSGDQAGTESQPNPSGRSEVSCDLKTQTASASTRAGAIEVGDVSIGSARFTGSSVRRVGEGVEVDSEATVHGVEIKATGTGTLRIADVRQRVITKAGGRPGTAKVVWESSIEGIHVLGPTGKTVFACAKNCDFQEVASHVNDVFSQVMRMRVPDSARTVTPGGAFAGFGETDADYINDLVMNNDIARAVPAIHLELYNDWGDKSRLVLQLAAIESSAIYGISSSGTFTDFDEPATPATQLPLTLPQPGAIEPPSFPSVPVAAVPPQVAAPPGSLIQRLVRSALFAARSPKDALSMALILTLFGAIAALGMRRDSLIKLLSKQRTT